MGESLSFQTHPIRDVDEREAPCGTALPVRWTAAKRRLDGVCSITSRVPSGVQKIPPGWREAIDKAPEMGYSKDTKGAASRTAPVCYREVTVTFGRVRRLLLFAILENQTNDSQNDHAELKQFTP